MIELTKGVVVTGAWPEAFYKYGANDKGQITWLISRRLNTTLYEVTFWGLDVLGDDIEPTTLEIPESEKINPEKVFWYIVKKIKKKLCPLCPV